MSTVVFDVRDLGGHLDVTCRGWAATLVARIRLVIRRVRLVAALPLDFMLGVGFSVQAH